MTARRLQIEFLAKGVALALLAFSTWAATDWTAVGLFFGVAVAGFLIALGVAAERRIREGYQVRGRLLPFLIFLVLENPTLIHAGLLSGMVVASLGLLFLGETASWHLPAFVAAGVVLGFLFRYLQNLPHRWVRTGTILVIAAATTAGVLLWLERTGILTAERRYLLGVQVLLAIPIVYMLALAGEVEETELEIASICVALGVGLWMLLPDNVRLFALGVPVAVYLVYTQQVIRKLRVFKHVIRGMSYHGLGKDRLALLAYRRALELEPKNKLAREGQWRVHRDMDSEKLLRDPDIRQLINLDLCLERAAELLTGPATSPEKISEAQKLLTLVLDQRPTAQPAVLYWRAVAHVQNRELDKAAEDLRTVLDPAEYPPNDPYRESVLTLCWLLALIENDDLRLRFGEPFLAEGRRMQAIADLRRYEQRQPNDRLTKPVRDLLYEGLTEAEHDDAAGAAGSLPPERFDYELCLGAGDTLLAQEENWRRGAEYLRIAAKGLPEKGPWIYARIAERCRAAGDEAAALSNDETVKKLARSLGVKNLPDADRKAYFATIKRLAENAYNRGDVPHAIENFTLYSESDQSGIDTLRIVTELHERSGNVLAALKSNEKALFYDRKNPQLLERKDRYYYSATPEQLRTNLDAVRNTFDIGYCIHKAKSLLDNRSADAELIDWALHLVELVRIVEPNNVAVLTLLARARLRRGEQRESVPLLEQVFNVEKERSFSADEEEAWYTAHRLLGDLYLQELGKPDLALQCFQRYREYSKSGADTLFKMGQAYEALGDAAKAAKCYQHVTIYTEHPLVSEAYSALHRLEVRS